MNVLQMPRTLTALIIMSVTVLFSMNTYGYSHTFVNRSKDKLRFHVVYSACSNNDFILNTDESYTINAGGCIISSMKVTIVNSITVIDTSITANQPHSWVGDGTFYVSEDARYNWTSSTTDPGTVYPPSHYLSKALAPVEAKIKAQEIKAQEKKEKEERAKKLKERRDKDKQAQNTNQTVQ